MTNPGDALEGVLPVDKPVGPTSHDAVAIARRALQTRRIGHTGTLDPFASGLLLLCVGRATRIAEYLTAQPKTYQAVLRFGEATSTDDHTGEVTARSERWRELTRADLETAFRRRVGRQLQAPPSFSAKKVAGERMYERARRGEENVAEAVEVAVHAIALTSWNPPLAGFETTCSSGTYIRAIARDIGIELETFAHLVELRRTAIGAISVDDAVPLESLREHGLDRPLLSPLAALAHLRRIDVDDAGAIEISHGRTLPADGAADGLVVVAHAGELLAIAAIHEDRVRPKKVLGGAHG